MRSQRAFHVYFVVWFVMAVGGYFLARRFVPVDQVMAALIALNAATFLLFGLDKAQAASHRLRAPEKLLFLATLCGGSLGTLFGMNLFRHKTRKVGFQFVVAFILLLQIIVLLVLYKQMKLY